MKLVAFTNESKTIAHIGNKMIFPGHTREVDETLIPGFKPATVVPEITDEHAELLTLLDESVPVIQANLAELSDGDLAVLESAENAGKTRKGVIAALADERLKRASAAQDSIDPETFAASLLEKSDEELGELGELHADDEVLTALITAELEKRTA